jgi:hypothetical protein
MCALSRLASSGLPKKEKSRPYFLFQSARTDARILPPKREEAKVCALPTHQDMCCAGARLDDDELVIAEVRWDGGGSRGGDVCGGPQESSRDQLRAMARPTGSSTAMVRRWTTPRPRATPKPSSMAKPMAMATWKPMAWLRAKRLRWARPRRKATQLRWARPRATPMRRAMARPMTMATWKPTACRGRSGCAGRRRGRGPRRGRRRGRG